MSETDSFEYKERVVAFVDVLGFSALVRRSETDPAAMDNVRKLVTVNELFYSFMTKFQLSTASFFSDSFVLSMQPDRVLYVVREIGYLCRYLLLQGLPCRGAITTGSLYHRGRFVLGPAFVSAAEMEKSVAVYPRVVLDDATMANWRLEFRVDEFGHRAQHASLENLVKRDRDGRHFIDIFNPEWGTGFIPWTEIIPSYDLVPTDPAEFLERARVSIDVGRAASAGDTKVREKYKWLATECGSHAALVQKS